MSQEQALEFKNSGNQAFKEGKFQDAIDNFTKAIAINPQDHILYSNRSGAYASLKDYENALEDAEICTNIKPDWAKGYQRKGLAEFYLNKFDDAIATYKKGLEIEPNNQQLQEGLQRVQQEKLTKDTSQKFGVDQTFLNGLLQRLATNPKTAGYLKDQDFLIKLQMMAQNPQMFPVLAQQDPRIQEALQVMMEGLDLGKMGKMPNMPGQEEKDSEGKFEEEPKPEPEPTHKESPMQTETTTTTKKPEPKQEEQLDEADQLKNQGNELFKKNEFEKALEAYEKAINLKPTELIYYNNKAACYQKQGNFSKAQEEIDRALKFAEENNIRTYEKIAKLYDRKACIYLSLEDYDNAITFFNKSLIEVNNPRVKDDLKKAEKLKKEKETKAYINPELAEQANNQARELFLQGKFPDAMKLYEEAIKRNPSDAKYYCNRGICYTKLMEFPSALRDFDQCLQLDPKYVKAWAKKGSCHQVLKELHKAQEAFEKGLQIDQENVECKEGLEKVTQQIYMPTGTKEEQEERAKRAMADPEIQQILMTAEVQNAMKALQQDPKEAQKIMKDPKLGPKFQKLIAAGILRFG